ncbi:MAG: GNAT family N-acetyltransferase [Clostridia bacterium]|nr:GNAT family N-acetyltransferase [Clostridia bacterium]
MKNWKVKWFTELTAAELYEILRARSEIFVVEQSCVYQDIDGKDPEALHVFCEEDGRATACLRAFREDDETVRMGRVLTLKHGTGLGGELLKRGLREIRERMAPQRIRIEAQTYAAGFYEREGFHVTSEEFMEDGIPHVEMILECGRCLVS